MSHTLILRIEPGVRSGDLESISIPYVHPKYTHHITNDICRGGYLNFPNIVNTLVDFDRRLNDPPLRRRIGYAGMEVYYGRLSVKMLRCTQEGVDKSKYEKIRKHPILIDHPIQALRLDKTMFIEVGHTRTLVRHIEKGEDSLQPSFIIHPLLQNYDHVWAHYERRVENYRMNPNNTSNTHWVAGMWINPDNFVRPPHPKTF